MIQFRIFFPSIVSVSFEMTNYLALALALAGSVALILALTLALAQIDEEEKIGFV